MCYNSRRANDCKNKTRFISHPYFQMYRQFASSAIHLSAMVQLFIHFIVCVCVRRRWLLLCSHCAVCLAIMAVHEHYDTILLMAVITVIVHSFSPEQCMHSAHRLNENTTNACGISIIKLINKC